MNKLFFFFFFFFSCDQVYLPKQKAFFAHQFPSPNYILSNNREKKLCKYSFQINELSEIKFDKKCNSIIKYKLLNSKLFLTNIKIDNNLELVNLDFNNRVAENSLKSNVIKSSEFNDVSRKVYAKYFTFIGDTPSNTQFYITDSISNYISGSLYFDSKPNYDSLLPSIKYMNNDIRKIIQTFKWN
jgi:gliding motility-associated lipoprotein GldD